ncbi:hypothetical protein GCM10022280_18250 [Sphingomonas swuensis]|uniref:Glycosyltransferase family 1 protein n=1 Tax=Sphingomonas swuensis TaxID=977800 RepID=A0ABP7SZQ1_9SPHN
MATLEIARSDHRAAGSSEAGRSSSHGEQPDKPLTIVHAITRLLLSGAEENTMATCLHQARCGHRVVLLHGPGADPSWRERFGDRMTFVDVPSLVHPLAPLADMQAVGDMRRLYRRFGADVVHTHGSKAGIVGRIAAALAGVSLVVHSIHIAPFLAVSRGQRLVYLAAERFCGRLTHLFIAVSRGMQQAFIDEGIGEGVPIQIVHSGMPVDRFIAASPPKNWAERIGGWSGAERPRFLLKVASFEPRKRQLALIRALAEGLRARPDVCLLLAGDGPERTRCEEEVATLGLTGQVRFLGHDPRPWELVALADIAVHAAEREGLPRTAVQAIAGGRPMVVAALPGIEEIIEDGVNGIVADPDEIGDIAHKIFALLDDPERLARMKRSAEQTDVSSWAEDRMGLRIDAAYAGVTAARERRARIASIEFLGLPGAGKTTIARELRSLLRDRRGGVRYSREMMGDDLPLWRRSARRALLIAGAFLRRPWAPIAAARGLTPGQSSVRDRIKTRWNFWSVMAMQARTTPPRLLINDQGLAQALWSARVQHGAAASCGNRRLPHCPGWLEQTLFVHVATPPLTARQRLSRRVRVTSRFQHPERRDDLALWEEGHQAIDRIERDLKDELEGAGLGDRLLRLDATMLSARSAALLIDEHLQHLEETEAERS